MAEEKDRIRMENGNRDEENGISAKRNEKIDKNLVEEVNEDENTSKERPKVLPQSWPRPQPQHRPPPQQQNIQFQDHGDRRAVTFGPPVRRDFQDPRAPGQGVVLRRPSPWAVLRAKLPTGENLPGPRPILNNEHYIQRMQNPSPQMRPPMPRPGSQEGIRAPFIPRNESPSPRPPSSPRPAASPARPPVRSSLSKDEEEDVVMNDLRAQTPLSRPPSGQKSTMPPSPQAGTFNQGHMQQQQMQGVQPIGGRPQQMTTSGPLQQQQNSQSYVPQSQNQSPKMQHPGFPQNQNLSQQNQNSIAQLQSQLSTAQSQNALSTPQNLPGTQNQIPSSSVQNSLPLSPSPAPSNHSSTTQSQSPAPPSHTSTPLSQSPAPINQNQSSHGQAATPTMSQNPTPTSQNTQAQSLSSTQSTPPSSGQQTPNPASPAPPSSTHDSVPPSPSLTRKLSSAANLSTSSPTPTPSPAKSPQPQKQGSINSLPELTVTEAQNISVKNTSLDKLNQNDSNKEIKSNSNEKLREEHPKPPVIVDATLKRPKDLKNSSSSIKAEETNKASKENEPPRTESSKQESPSKEPVINGNHESPKKTSKAAPPKKLGTAQSPLKSPNKPQPKTPETPGTADKKKLPMNKVQVGAAPSPNLKSVKSKIGSLENAKHKPGGGNIKIENRKLTFSAAPKIAAKNDAYQPGGGDKKIQQVKLQWNAKSKIGSLENAAHKPGGGDKKIESVKLDFKEKAKPKVGSKDNIKHVAGGGNVKIEDQKLDIKAESKIGSLDNVKHRPGGGDKKIFDDKDYLKQMTSSHDSLNMSPMHKSQTDEES